MFAMGFSDVTFKCLCLLRQCFSTLFTEQLAAQRNILTDAKSATEGQEVCYSSLKMYSLF